MLKIDRFDIYWWVKSDDTELYRYATKLPTDIVRVTGTHFSITARPLFHAADDILSLVLQLQKGVWTVRSDSFDEPEDYPISYAEGTSEAVWTDAQGDELMVIQGTYVS